MDIDAVVFGNPENIQYFTGIMEPSLHACGFVIIPRLGRPILAALWLDKEVLKALNYDYDTYDIVAYHPNNMGKTVVQILTRLGAKKRIGLDSRALTLLQNHLSKSLQTETINVSNMIEEMRSIKSEEEISYVREACKISEQGIEAIVQSLKPGMTELQLAAIAEKEMMMLGSDVVKHRIIVASGYRASLVHPFASQKRIDKGELVAVDLGAVVSGYCSDIARTFVLGKPSEEVETVFNILKSVHELFLEKLNIGMSIGGIEKMARDHVITEGYQLVGHVGHSIGLKVEERPFLDATRSNPEYMIQEGMLFAFCQALVIRGRHHLGVRLEDTALVTKSGLEILTKYPRELLRIS